MLYLNQGMLPSNLTWAIFRLEFQMLLEQSFITFYVNRHTAPLNNQQELTDKS